MEVKIPRPSNPSAFCCYFTEIQSTKYLTVKNVKNADLRVTGPAPPAGVVPEPAHQVAEEERLRAELHAVQPGRPGRGRVRERGGGRGVQQAAGPRLGRRQDPPAAAQAPPGLLRAAPGAAPRLTCTPGACTAPQRRCMPGKLASKMDRVFKKKKERERIKPR